MMRLKSSFATVKTFLFHNLGGHISRARSLFRRIASSMSLRLGSHRLKPITGIFKRTLSSLWRPARVLAITTTFLAALLLALISYYPTPSKPTYFIAYVGRYQTEALDNLNVKLLSKYVNELNANVQTAHFELINFNIHIRDNIYDSQSAYGTIANNEKIILVIDNTWGIDLAAVAKIIEIKQLPVISMNADKQGVTYNDRVVFIGNDDQLPKRIVAFAKRILHNKDIILVAEETFPSTASFRRGFPRAKTFLVSSANVNEVEKRKLQQGLGQELDRRVPNARRRTLIINTHSLWGNEIIRFVNPDNSRYAAIDILGGPYITNQKLNEIKLASDNKLIVFTNSSDATTRKVYLEVENIKVAHPELSKSLNTELYVERCLNAIAITRKVILGNETRTFGFSREAFMAAFQKMADSYFAIDHELYSFYDGLSLKDKRVFVQLLSNGEISSYSQQLNYLATAVIPNIHIGLDDVKISFIDTKKGSFHGEFNYWLKYDAPKLDATKYLRFQNLITGESEEISRRKSTASEVYRRFRMSGDFKMSFDLTRYPLDQQEATIELGATYPDEEVGISLDRKNYEQFDQEFGVWSDEWDKVKSNVTIDNIMSVPGGNGRYNNPQRLETLNIRTQIKRNKFTGPLITLMLPLWLMGLSAVSVLYVRESSLSHIGHISVGIFLAIAMYRISLAEIMPDAGGSGTLVDRLFVETFFVSFIVLLKVIILNSRIISEDVKTRIDNRAAIIGHGVFIAYCVGMVLVLNGWDLLIYDSLIRHWSRPLALMHLR